ncbi:protein-disulfide reductase DsbD [Seminibacterium arietis]|uniref:Thiol:disulfide interchange protein DsbD n=1 Tax=Seminibacterium arietis TaxID=1173502 RepID=A0ABW3I7K4_9PAST
MKKIILILLLFFTALSSYAGFFDKKPHFLSADEAFQFSIDQQDNKLVLQWDIAENYYLYKKEISLTNSKGEYLILDYPPAEKYQDEFFGETEIYRNKLSLLLPFEQLKENKLLLTYQGCTKGFCYPPEKRDISLEGLEFLQPESENIVTSENDTPLITNNQSELVQSLLSSKWAVFSFFLLGLGLAFTPCVLPMFPLLSAIVIGTQQRSNTIRSLALSVTYVQGMALTYTLLGLAVVSIGHSLQTILQSPSVLIGLSVLFVLLALSMFGLYSLQLPSSLQTKLTLLSQKQKSGAFGGVFVMGVIAGLVASPCTSAPLSGALLYVAQTGDLFFGAITLYLLALGMGLPLILITVFGNSILPKSGIWLDKVKTSFGFVMLTLPIFLLSRILPEIWENLLWATLGASFFLWLSFQMNKKGFSLLLRILFIIVAIIIVKPLQDWAWQTQGEMKELSQFNQFQRVNSYAELQELLQKEKRIVMLDLYADWCVACKEFEKYTFTDPQVRLKFKDILLLQMDMTRNTPENIELIEKLQIIGLPTILFFDAKGKEIPHSRISGFMPASEFSDWLTKKIVNK